MTNHDSGTAGDEAREPARLPRAITYYQAETGYRSTIDARERFEELTNRDLTVRAHATLKARGTYDPQLHGDADKYQPLTAEEHLEILAAGEMLARYYRHPRSCTRQSPPVPRGPRSLNQPAQTRRRCGRPTGSGPTASIACTPATRASSAWTTPSTPMRSAGPPSRKPRRARDDSW
jgi:hypothetical protein